MRTSTIRFAAAAVLSTGAIALAARPGVAAKAPRKGACFLTSFVQDDRTDVRRNEVLEFKFTTLLRPGSVDDRTLRISEITGTGTKPAPGARIVRGNVVRFDPTRTQRNYDDSRKPNTLVTDKDHTAGFTSYQDFDVEIPSAPNDLHTIKSLNGAAVSRFFAGGFRTNSLYLDPVEGQPSFTGDHGTGLLGFDPPRSGATGLVDEDAVVVLEFSEPINIDTLDPSSTVVVTRITVNEQVPGYVKADPNEPNGRRFLFVPSVGFGSDLANQQGWDIQVKLTTGITDLAGNALKRPITFPVFRTRYAPGKPSCSVIVESFNDQKLMDPQTVTKGGEWNTIEKGALRGGTPTTYPNIDVIYTVANTGVTGLVRLAGGLQEPLVGKTVPTGGAGGGCTAMLNGCRTQMLYVPSDVGVEAAITRIGWGPSSNALFSATYPDIRIDVGHTSVQSLGATFESNINIGTPLRTYQGLYDVPQAKNINGQGTGGTDPVDSQGISKNPNATGMWDWPAFTTPFEWNGVNNLVLDFQVPGGNNCQILRAAFVAAGIPFPARRAVDRSSYQATTAGFVVDAIIYDTRFKKRRRTTQAISTWYQLASDNPIFAAPVVSPVGQPGGVSVLLELEGAHGRADPFNPGGFIADPTTGTGFTTTASDIDGHRFFRFRISMFANLNTNQTARVTAVQFPYCF